MKDELREAILTVTGGVAWNTVQKALEGDIENYKIQLIYSKSWDETNEIKGKIAATLTFINIREQAKIEEAANASV